MIRSMTGYGGAKGTADTLQFTVELKSVNNRYLDCNVRLPRGFLYAEETVKAAVQRHISRGKVDVYVNLDGAAASDTVVAVNLPLAESYRAALQKIAASCGVPDDATAALLARFPDVLTVEKRESDREAVLSGLTALLEEALAAYDQMRLREGEKLRQDVEGRLVEIERLVALVEERSPQLVEEYRGKLLQRMEEVLQSRDLDPQRILLEAALFADKTAVNEETVRLRSHISQMRQMLADGSPAGRKLDFLIQEFNREANTIGSKCNDGALAKVVVDMKSEIEKIREQIQNIE